MQHDEAAERMVHWARIADDLGVNGQYAQQVIREGVVAAATLARMWADVSRELREGGEVSDGPAASVPAAPEG